MMSNDEWEEINLPQGTFFGWGKVGQTFQAEVVNFDPTGGSDFNGGTCPQLVGIAIGELETYRDKGTRREAIGDGDFVTLTCGQAQLAKKVTAAAPTAGDIIRIVYDSDYKTGKGTGKGFTVKVKRGQPRAQAAPPPNSRSDLF
jgi:hypothetical protein